MRQVYVTSRSIYYVSDNLCTRVVARDTQKTVHDHPAAGAYLTGGFLRTEFRFEPTFSRTPVAGEHLCFAAESGTVISSPLERVLHVVDGSAPRVPERGYEDEPGRAETSSWGR